MLLPLVSGTRSIFRDAFSAGTAWVPLSTTPKLALQLVLLRRTQGSFGNKRLWVLQQQQGLCIPPEQHHTGDYNSAPSHSHGPNLFCAMGAAGKEPDTAAVPSSSGTTPAPRLASCRPPFGVLVPCSSARCSHSQSPGDRQAGKLLRNTSNSCRTTAKHCWMLFEENLQHAVSLELKFYLGLRVSGLPCCCQCKSGLSSCFQLCQQAGYLKALCCLAAAVAAPADPCPHLPAVLQALPAGHTQPSSWPSYQSLGASPAALAASRRARVSRSSTTNLDGIPWHKPSSCQLPNASAGIWAAAAAAAAAEGNSRSLGRGCACRHCC